MLIPSSFPKGVWVNREISRAMLLRLNVSDDKIATTYQYVINHYKNVYGIELILHDRNFFLMIDTQKLIKHTTLPIEDIRKVWASNTYPDKKYRTNHDMLKAGLLYINTFLKQLKCLK